MGKGNPEGADAAHARGTPSVCCEYDLRYWVENNSTRQSIHWVQLRGENSYKRFEQVLTALSIPCQPFEGDLQETLDKILPLILSDDIQPSVTPDILLQGQSVDDSQLLVDFE